MKNIIILLGTIALVGTVWAEKRDVSFKSGELTLRGTLYLPKGAGPFPAVVFVHGSGPETRDNSSYSAKWFASIGYVALTYDKRGAGESDGLKDDWNRFSFQNLSDDVVAAAKFLSEMGEVDRTKIGLHATSQGGWVAPLAATKTDLINFMIIKSASVCSVGDDRIFERSARLYSEGFSESEIAEAQEMQRVEARTIDDNQKPDDFTRFFEKNKDKNWFSRVYGGSDPLSESLTNYRKWYATIVDFDSVPYLEETELPVFWIFGHPDLDRLGPVEQSMNRLKELQERGKPYTIVSYEGEGHNVKERKYELDLYQWLAGLHGERGFKFRKH